MTTYIEKIENRMERKNKRFLIAQFSKDLHNINPSYSKTRVDKMAQIMYHIYHAPEYKGKTSGQLYFEMHKLNPYQKKNIDDFVGGN